MTLSGVEVPGLRSPRPRGDRQAADGCRVRRPISQPRGSGEPAAGRDQCSLNEPSLASSPSIRGPCAVVLVGTDPTGVPAGRAPPCSRGSPCAGSARARARHRSPARCRGTLSARGVDELQAAPRRRTSRARWHLTRGFEWRPTRSGRPCAAGLKSAFPVNRPQPPNSRFPRALVIWVHGAERHRIDPGEDGRRPLKLDLNRRRGCRRV